MVTWLVSPKKQKVIDALYAQLHDCFHTIPVNKLYWLYCSLPFTLNRDAFPAKMGHIKDLSPPMQIFDRFSKYEAVHASASSDGMDASIVSETTTVAGVLVDFSSGALDGGNTITDNAQ